MKRMICLLLAAILLCFSGCSEPTDDSVTFFYLRREFTLGEPDSVIASEQRELSGHKDDLNYILGIYLEGPIEDSLYSPFPSGTRLLRFRSIDQLLILELSDEFAQLNGMTRTLAAGCLAYTCFSNSDAEKVRIDCGDHITIELTPEMLTLWDSSASVSATQP